MKPTLRFRGVRARLLPDLLGQDRFAGALEGECRGGWYLVLLRVRRQSRAWMAMLSLCRAGEAVQEFHLLQPSARWPFGFKLGIAFVAAGPDRAVARLHGARWVPEHVELRLRPIPPVLAALGVLLQNPGKFVAGLRQAPGPWRGRVRHALAVSAINGQRLPEGYGSWLMYFDSWSDRRIAGLLAGMTERPAVQVVVFHAGPPGPALQATLGSVRDGAYPVAGVDVVRPGAPLPCPAAPFVAVLQAGEVLAPHALPLLLRAMDRADAAYADEDRLGAHGGRGEPWFKPQPGLMGMCSGLLSRGVWLVRSSLLTGDSGWAEGVRLQAWFRLYAAGRGDRVRRVPALLTHRRADAEAAPAALLAEVVSAGLRQLGVAASAEAGFPVRLRWDVAGTRTVSIVVPSRLRGGVTLDCLLDVVGRTAYPHLSMLVVVTQEAALDAEQAEAARRLEATGRADVALLRRGRFNFSAACNFGAALTDGELICLLNDDVSLIEGDWLGRMAAMFSDPAVGIVGAKLYYPDGRTQHGGVVMGLAGLAEHAHRWLPRGEPGYMGRAVLDQEMSAVTGACLLIRRDLFEQVGGLDESLPTAFNDVDLCLRVRETGHTVIMAGSVELVHHETLTFGHHYGASNTAAEMADVRRMQARWKSVVAADPYHNPNLSLLPNSEWELAVPPRDERQGGYAAR